MNLLTTASETNETKDLVSLETVRSPQNGATNRVRDFRSWLAKSDLPDAIRVQAELCLIWLRHLSHNRKSPLVGKAAADFQKLEAMLGGAR